jgi:putative FmdB family regulatory protein
MPAYDYKCPECDAIMHAQHAMDETPELWCIKCQVVMNKTFSAPQVNFKGGGWGKDAR